MDDDQQFCLRWNNHQSTLVSVFDTLLEKGIHVDCTLAAEGQTLKAHKVVLSACSPYFESVLSQQYDKHPIIILKDVKYAELRAMMDYMYRGEVNISQDQLAALLKAAESLQIKGLSDNKPSRPPSRPPQAAQAHPPRAASPPPQVLKLKSVSSPQTRDGSIDSREGSISPTRRRKKARRMSDAPAPAPAPPAPDAPAPDPAPCKEEPPRDGVEDLTLDEEPDDAPPVGHNDVVRNFQWHMERSQDEIMNSNDSARESQEPSIDIKDSKIFAKTPFPLTRGYLKGTECKKENIDYNEKRTVKKVFKRRVVIKTAHNLRRKLEVGPSGSKGGKKAGGHEKKYVCSICQTKQYKYRRNKLRHEKYECVTGPQFACECGKKYSQKKTLVTHIQMKHRNLAIAKRRNKKKTSENNN